MECSAALPNCLQLLLWALIAASVRDDVSSDVILLFRNRRLPGRFMHNNRDDIPQLITKPPHLFLGAIAIALTLNAFFPLPLSLGVFTSSVGIVLCLCGVFLFTQGLRAFKAAKTSPNPNHEAVALIHSGPYRYSRNPLYLSLFVFLLGLALGLDNFWILAMLLPLLGVIQFGVVLPEERYLENKFGDSYREYKTRVPRWI